MLSPKFGRRNQSQQYQQQNVVDPYNTNTSNSTLNNTYRQQQYNRTQRNEPQISLSQANLNQKNESTGFLASLGTLGRKKKQQEGKFCLRSVSRSMFQYLVRKLINCCCSDLISHGVDSRTGRK